MKGNIRAIILLLLVFGCSEKENVRTNHAPTGEFQISQGLYQFTLDGRLSKDQDGDALTYQWNSSSDKITIASPTSSRAFITVPLSTAPFNVDITLSVSDGKLTTTSTKTVSIATQPKSYGLGDNLTKASGAFSNYDWYYDQGITGQYSSINCGPTSVTMAIKWVNKNFSLTPENARETYRSSGGWWYTSDIINYLDIYGVSNSTIQLTSIDLLKDKIDEGNIVILCLDMYYVDLQASENYHVNKFYSANSKGWGHFIVIKGYVEVDDNTYFEVYDPYSLGVKYADNSLKGKDRYYNAANLDEATNNWWDYAIVVAKPGSGGRLAPDPNRINPSTIQHMAGQ